MTDQLKGAASGLQDSVSSGAGKVSSTVQNPTGSSSEGSQNWESLTESQKHQAFDSIPADKKKDLTYTEWVKQGYQHQMENWVSPWVIVFSFDLALQPQLI